ncbi:MAG: OmpH family outer membrane protein [Candidatus Bathyarchaeota archaeon]|nr:OmpH family outer membrane protein [Candidatus Bathyarchaeota archaeon]
MEQPFFHSVSHNFISEKIRDAKKSVFLATPGITNIVCDALIECSTKLKGWNEIAIVIDPSPKIYYLGYGESDTLKKLESSGCRIRCEENLRVGLLIVDEIVYLFSPLSLNLESDDECENSVNGLTLNSNESNFLTEKVNPSEDGIEPSIGSREISEMELEIVENTIKNNPPQKPDLTRKLSVLTSQFQFVDLSFKGSQLQNAKTSLNARELGIVDEDLVKRISGQYKVFERLPEEYEKGMSNLKGKYKKLRDRFTKTIGDFGTIVWISQSKEFEEELKSLKKEIDSFNKNVIEEIVTEVSNSKKRLKEFINENYKISQQQSFTQKLAEIKKEKLIDDIIEKAFSAYTQEELSKNLEIKYKYYNISSQMASDEAFNNKVEELLGLKLDDLVKYENAFGVNK